MAVRRAARGSLERIFEFVEGLKPICSLIGGKAYILVAYFAHVYRDVGPRRIIFNRTFRPGITVLLLLTILIQVSPYDVPEASTLRLFLDLKLVWVWAIHAQ